jgi:tripartite-type tricarboxylate transporter receptor subunit TctC
MLGAMALLLAAPWALAQYPAKTLTIVIGYAPGGYAGTFTLVASELYKTMAGLRTVAITYKVPQQSMAALLSGQLDFLIQDATNVLRQVTSGNMRALAVTSQQRSSLLPDVPAMQELGFPGYDLLGWFGLYLPAHAPAPVVEKLAGWFNEMVSEEETRRFLANIGSEPFPGSARSLAELQARELEKWGRLLKAAKVEPE